MGTVTIENGHGELAYEMTIELLTSAHGKSHFVERMFDKEGSETFDPTVCVEVETDIGLYRLKSGDVIKINLEVS